MAFTAPTPAEFKLRFPEFESQEDARITLFINDAVNLLEEDVWEEADWKLAVTYLAAFLLEDGGYMGKVTSSGAVGPIRSQSLRGMSQTYAIEGRSDASIFKGNRYGMYFLWLLRRKVGGFIEVV